MKGKDLRIILIIAAIGGLLLFIAFGFVGAVGWSVANQQCPGGNDCHDAQFAAVFGTAMAVFGFALMVPAIRQAFVDRKK
ncbi:hypothetical protein [Ochrobactrum sp. Marseille-Q0166]|uniref:hypothetical protein n=1 Tax=Ochrobactrum sp. Marseille-Q0166 TaxID=2761105 RepID=UPI001655A6E3|nr:hypothetical protein [Ochrobactrum sp. Marseille-Q0166]MBC8717494.1 hypothetical protein [Ochrobactrum sp. Marseille-Q0166]